MMVGNFQSEMTLSMLTDMFVSHETPFIIFRNNGRNAKLIYILEFYRLNCLIHIVPKNKCGNFVGTYFSPLTYSRIALFLPWQMLMRTF